MLELKKNPMVVFKICLALVVGLFLFTAINASFNPRVQAAGNSEQIADSSSELPSFRNLNGIIPNSKDIPPVTLGSFLKNIVEGTSIYAFINNAAVKETPSGIPITVFGWQELLMIAVGFLVIYLGAAKNFEPILLIPIGFGIVFVNVPFAGMGEGEGFLNIIYHAGVGNELFPLMIFIGIGAMTDFGPLIANPKTAILGAAAQFGVFGTLFFISVANYLPGVAFNLKEACAVAIIGGADGPTTIYIAAKLAPHLLATVAVAAYSYMALVPLIQPPIMRALTTKKERLIKMKQMRPVSKTEKIFFPLVVFSLALLLIPSAAPLIGCLMFGNFIREIGVVDRLSKTAQNELMNIVSMFLSLGVGSQMTPEKFLNPSSLIIVVMGLVAFSVATASGLLIAKLMNVFLKEKINPLIGSAGVSAVPMAARVSNKVGLEEDPSNFILMHAMGPNVAGVIGTAIAAGVMIAVYGG
ncbi:sodium ion-translocating decarboxylase subunit beta [Leadbettera azotonutricia]|uniref:Oxaloacetate decarboxylase, subunit beta n=1 Tax=Leadbettera azotonutricia (strain ATCC BAA-888 / DSM 13862 / ZAS-9) TaxID=545695 RepID=F5Y8V0_LEAAZ|nr:sodium ion-translocating decarboxylase subunit beta [Leadbettera azotonutricia]AEF83204.1 oxaloacetate decarboxylase, subunit beta [Leadbettera azotonutricia ZAS-9]